MLRAAIDFGTSSTCAAVSVDGRPPQVVVVDSSPLMPSAVYASPDGTLFVGHEADRQAAVDPSRYEPHPKRRIDEPELLLGDAVVPVIGVVRSVLRRALAEVRHLVAGAPVDQLVLTHPADWGGTRTEKLRRCAHGLAGDIVLVPEPVAAAVFHSAGATVPEGGLLAVLDVGGGTVDASVVRRTGASFAVLGTRGDPTFGGADVDQALLEHVGSLVADTDPDAWLRLVEGRELADRRRRRVLRQDVRGAKETLSRHTYTDVPMPPPFPDAHVTRADLERLIAAPMNRTADLLAATLRDAGVRPEQLAGVFLVGGSSRIPMVSRLLHERLGLVPVTLDQPETVVARGALWVVPGEPGRAPGPAHGSASPPLGLPLPPGAPHPPGAYPQHAAPGSPAAYPGQHAAAPGRPGQHGGPGPQPGAPGSPQHGGPGSGPQLGAPGSSQLGPPGSPQLGGAPHTAADPQGARPHPHAAPAPHGGPPGGPGSPAGARPRGRRSRTPWLVAAAVLGVVAVGAVLAQVLGDDGDGDDGEQRVTAHHYSFVVPDGWERDGGDDAARQTDVGPVDAAVTPDRIFVREVELAYDADADRDRAVDELREQYEARRAAEDPPGVDGFEPAASFAGREVLRYSEVVTNGTVDWYVVFGGAYQVSVGCRHDQVGADRVRTACDRVVSSLTIDAEG